MDEKQKCKRLLDQGRSLRQIARQLGVARNTVRRSVRSGDRAEPGEVNSRGRGRAPEEDARERPRRSA